MSLTNFAALTSEQYTVWARRLWREQQLYSELTGFVGDGPTSMIQRIQELKQTKTGNRCVVTLLNHGKGNPIVGDNQAKGNEAAMSADDNVILFDQLRFPYANTGRMADQKSVVEFRGNAKTEIALNHAETWDELAMLTLSGISYGFNVDGTARVGSQLPQLEFAASVTAPSPARHRRWDASTGLEPGDTTQVATADTLSWDALVEMKAYAQNTWLPPIRTTDGVVGYNVFVSIDGMKALKKDSKFWDAIKDARERGQSNQLFKGTPHGTLRGVFVDGMNVMEYRNVYHPSNWGGGTVAGQRVLFCGAQALGYADPMGVGAPGWDEEKDDYNNRYGIAGRKVYGFLKPKWFLERLNSIEDHAVLCVDTAV